MLLKKYSLYGEFEALWEGESATDEQAFEYLNFVLKRPPRTPAEAATYLKIAQKLTGPPVGRSTAAADQLMTLVQEFLIRE